MAIRLYEIAQVVGKTIKTVDNKSNPDRDIFVLNFSDGTFIEIYSRIESDGEASSINVSNGNEGW